MQAVLAGGTTGPSFSHLSFIDQHQALPAVQSTNPFQ